MKRGFTLIELVVVVAVILILASMLLPWIANISDRAKAAKVCSLYDTSKAACNLHYQDTSAYAREYDMTEGYPGVGSWQLNFRQSYSGWNGPYLDRGITWAADHPFPPNNDIDVCENLNGCIITTDGFDLTRDGTQDTGSGAGNMLGFANIPENFAKLVDDRIDGPSAGSGVSWKVCGIVEYNGHMGMYIIGGTR